MELSTKGGTIVALWAPYDRYACTSTARDTQYYATSPEPVSLHNISSPISCVYSYHNVHMYTLNKVSTLLPLVLITSYCVGPSTACRLKANVGRAIYVRYRCIKPHIYVI